MKIGFFMGSFDPIHIGHVNMIREALNYVDKIIVVPSGHNPWKKDIEPAPFTYRMQMIAYSIRNFGDKVEVSGIESSFEPPYYANKPLNHFKEQYSNDDKYIICGSDTVYKIPYWKDAVTDILPFYKILCLERDSNGLHGKVNCVTKKLTDKNGNEYEFIHVFIHPLPISSTYVRNLSKENKALYPLVTQEVENFINERGLYK